MSALRLGATRVAPAPACQPASPRPSAILWPPLRVPTSTASVAPLATASPRSWLCARCKRPVAPAASDSAAAAAAAPDGLEFNWPAALVFAGCAFEAYSTCVGESLKETTPGGSHIRYVDKEFLLEKMAGLMAVTVKSAADLPPPEMLRQMDPYCVVSIGDSSGTTSVLQGLNPAQEAVWDETFYLFVRDPAAQRLTARLLDADLGRSDALLGSTLRGLADLCSGAPQELELALRGRGAGAAPRLRLEATFLPFTELLADSTARFGMGAPVLGAPEPALLSSPWRALMMRAAAHAFRPLCFIDNEATDTQAWVFWRREDRALCVAFRGTEQTKWRDILTDLSVAPTSMDPEGVGGSGAAAAPGGSLQPEAAKPVWQQLASGLGGVLQAVAGGGGEEAEQQQQQQQPPPSAGQGAVSEEEWVHQGFMSAYQSVRGQVLGVVDAVLAGEDQPWRVCTTGHSLGGALSTLCAFDLARRTNWRGAARPSVANYSYGSPRAGNRAFARRYDELVPDTWRVVNANDAVCAVPRLMGYCHVGHAVRLLEGGAVEVQRNSSGEVGEGASAPEVLPAMALAVGSTVAQEVLAATGLAQAASDQGEPSGDAAQELLAAELAALNALLDGSGIEEHMEDLYMANLAAAIDALMAAGSGSEQE